MSIIPLPVFEADADPRHREAMTDEEIYARLEPPKTIVIKFGYMKMIAEYPYAGDARPGCGSKLVARTHRGTEVVEMLTTTCENAGCNKSITRKEMLEYIENSGGRDYPFHQNGRILRVATIEDLNRQSALDNDKPRYISTCKALIRELGLAMKLVEVEPILGGELLTFFYMSEERVDFRELVRQLAGEFKTRIEMRQVGARDEARLVADYERCGQYCCCKNFLKVLKPVSMKSAKLQKATLDPLKISGRCGRLMCCLRYEDQTYKELKKNLPKFGKRVGTVEGPGHVIETRLLVQLALVRLEHDGREIAVPVEELLDPDTCPKPGEHAAKELAAESDPLRGMTEAEVKERVESDEQPRRKRSKSRRSRAERQDDYRKKSQAEDHAEAKGESQVDQPADAPTKPMKKRKRRRGRSRDQDKSSTSPSAERQSGGDPAGKGSGKRRRRRRRGGQGPKGDRGGDAGSD